MFKGMASPCEFLATVASDASPRLNHACFEEGVHVCFETLWGRGGGCNTHTTFFEKSFLRALRAGWVLFFLAPRSASRRFSSLARFPWDFNGDVRQSPSIVASDS